ncbi:MAG: hypothetical protein GY704_00050, partial [Phycisphaeraceae bacterium]|nr:hypothetical protein [Phycisphaeraceae bacterium]
MILTIASLGLSALAPLAGGQDTAAIEAAAPAAPGPVLQIQASEVHVGDGTVISNGVVVIQNGRITKVGADVTLDDKHPVLHHDGVLSAGMIACHSQMSVAGDDFEEARTIVPEARIAHAIRPDHPHFQKALAAGITSIVISPSEENLVGGLTAVVKTSDGSVAKDGAHLAMSFTHAALSAGQMPFLFFFAAEGAAQAKEGGLENTDSGSSGSRYPT